MRPEVKNLLKESALFTVVIAVLVFIVFIIVGFVYLVDYNKFFGLLLLPLSFIGYFSINYLCRSGKL